MIKLIRKILEKQFFGVCQWLGDKLGMKSSRIRLYFIYLSFVTVASPIIAYLIMAFALEHKDMIKEGFESLDPSDENEDDMLDKAWGLCPQSRLSCQSILKDKDLTIEIPKYTINLASEG